ncbi:MAG TPA: peptidoglycan bridge formation glycyltransferase FemA/FemB family protein [Euzebyales bacterium]|nr:peptidoglycan bridge formation glycyltransferase FemA/FemB family protein [Euzebyales bacterium]
MSQTEMHPSADATPPAGSELAVAGAHIGPGRAVGPHRIGPAVRTAVDARTVDEEWDAFVATAPGGGYLQTSRWGQVKAQNGWVATRIKVYEDDQLVGGCQLLRRSVVKVAAVGYVARGPLFGSQYSALCGVVLEALERYARRRRLVHLKVQPPGGGPDVIPELAARGFRQSSLAVCPQATTRIDLRRDREDLLAATARSTRTGIRAAARRGVVVRPGTEADLPFFSAAVQRTARRQGFTPYAASYYERMWRIFAADGHAHLLVAEHDGVPLSAQLLVAYNDTVTAKMIGWSGARGDLHPNRALDWASIQWARAQGHRWYDLDGVDLSVARSMRDGVKPVRLPGPQRYKAGFGGQAVIFPPPMDRTAQVIATALRVVEQSARGKRLVRRLGTRQRPMGPA